jgi:hypothetical protein
MSSILEVIYKVALNIFEEFCRVALKNLLDCSRGVRTESTGLLLVYWKESKGLQMCWKENTWWLQYVERNLPDGSKYVGRSLQDGSKYVIGICSAQGGSHYVGKNLQGGSKCIGRNLPGGHNVLRESTGWI